MLKKQLQSMILLLVLFAIVSGLVAGCSSDQVGLMRSDADKKKSNEAIANKVKRDK